MLHLFVGAVSRHPLYPYAALPAGFLPQSRTPGASATGVARTDTHGPWTGGRRSLVTVVFDRSGSWGWGVFTVAYSCVAGESDTPATHSYAFDVALAETLSSALVPLPPVIDGTADAAD